MPRSHELGRWGENVAAQWLADQGWKIVARNWRHGPLELDLVAWQGEVLVFIEVKTARYTGHGAPDVRVTPAKQRALARAAAGGENRRHAPASKRRPTAPRQEFSP